jgi:hypothetical protein
MYPCPFDDDVIFRIQQFNTHEKSQILPALYYLEKSLQRYRFEMRSVSGDDGRTSIKEEEPSGDDPSSLPNPLNLNPRVKVQA